MVKQVFNPGNFIGFYTTLQINNFPVEIRQIGSFVYDTTTQELRAYGVSGEAYPTVLWGGPGVLLMLEGAGNPIGVVTGYYGQDYRNTASGVIYKCISNPSGTAWVVV